MHIKTTLLGIVLLFGGCAAQNQPKMALAPATVPAEARLVGLGTPSTITLPNQSPGTFYLVDDVSGKMAWMATLPAASQPYTVQMVLNELKRQETLETQTTQPVDAIDTNFLRSDGLYRLYYLPAQQTGKSSATQSTSASPKRTMRATPLPGKSAQDAVEGAPLAGAEYVDLMPDGMIVLIDKTVSREQFRAGVEKIVAKGDLRLIVRVADHTSPALYAFVRDTARSAGIQVMNVVRVDASSMTAIPWKTP